MDDILHVYDLGDVEFRNLVRLIVASGDHFGRGFQRRTLTHLQMRWYLEGRHADAERAGWFGEKQLMDLKVSALVALAYLRVSRENKHHLITADKH